MLLSRKSVELLAPVGTWEVLEAAITAGADAVYLGGKRFNMRMHRTDTNFDDELLVKAIKYAHERNVLVYITVNNFHVWEPYPYKIANKAISEIKNIYYKI